MGTREHDLAQMCVRALDSRFDRGDVGVPSHHDGVEALARGCCAHELRDVSGDGVGELLEQECHVFALDRKGRGVPVGSADEAVEADRDVVDEFAHDCSVPRAVPWLRRRPGDPVCLVEQSLQML